MGSQGHKLMNYLPDYVQASLKSRKRSKGSNDLEYEHFYILLKFALNRQLHRLRPYYFTSESAGEDALVNRLECANPKSVLISGVKLHISAVLQLIYDYYQSNVLQSYWRLCKSIIHAIIKDDRNKKLVVIKEKQRPSLSGSMIRQEEPD